MSTASNQEKETSDLAIGLMLAISRLRHSKPPRPRIRVGDLSIPQLLLLRRIQEAGETTAADLADSEHVSQQAIAQDLAALKREGFVEARRDPQDRRKNPVHVTDAGRLAIDSYLARRTNWLARRIASRIEPIERGELRRTIELLERLAFAEGELEQDA